jgi:hypothetical protein
LAAIDVRAVLDAANVEHPVVLERTERTERHTVIAAARHTPSSELEAHRPRQPVRPCAAADRAPEPHRVTAAQPTVHRRWSLRSVASAKLLASDGLAGRVVGVAVAEVTSTTTRLLASLPARRQPTKTVPLLRRPEVRARPNLA